MFPCSAPVDADVRTIFLVCLFVTMQLGSTHIVSCHDVNVAFDCSSFCPPWSLGSPLLPSPMSYSLPPVQRSSSLLTVGLPLCYESNHACITIYHNRRVDNEICTLCTRTCGVRKVGKGGKRAGKRRTSANGLNIKYKRKVITHISYIVAERTYTRWRSEEHAGMGFR